MEVPATRIRHVPLAVDRCSHAGERRFHKIYTIAALNPHRLVQKVLPRHHLMYRQVVNEPSELVECKYAGFR